MAVYLLSVRSVSRTTGRSAPAAAAYRAGAMIINQRDGKKHDYRRRRDVETSFILAPQDCEWAQDRSRLWNVAEAAENRRDAKVAREYLLGLPEELGQAGRRELSEKFGVFGRDRYGVAVDVAIHEPRADGDERNFHAHVLTTTRMVDATGVGAKTRQLDVSTSASKEVELLRGEWQQLVNTALEHAGSEERVTHLSHARQGTGTVPQITLGVAASGLERRGIHTDKGDRNREIAAINAELAKLAAKSARLRAATRWAERRAAKFCFPSHNTKPARSIQPFLFTAYQALPDRRTAGTRYGPSVGHPSARSFIATVKVTPLAAFQHVAEPTTPLQPPSFSEARAASDRRLARARQALGIGLLRPKSSYDVAARAIAAVELEQRPAAAEYAVSQTQSLPNPEQAHHAVFRPSETVKPLASPNVAKSSTAAASAPGSSPSHGSVSSPDLSAVPRLSLGPDRREPTTAEFLEIRALAAVNTPAVLRGGAAFAFLTDGTFLRNKAKPFSHPTLAATGHLRGKGPAIVREYPVDAAEIEDAHARAIPRQPLLSQKSSAPSVTNQNSPGRTTNPPSKPSLTPRRRLSENGVRLPPERGPDQPSPSPPPPSPTPRIISATPDAPQPWFVTLPSRDAPSRPLEPRIEPAAPPPATPPRAKQSVAPRQFVIVELPPLDPASRAPPTRSAPAQNPALQLRTPSPPAPGLNTRDTAATRTVSPTPQRPPRDTSAEPVTTSGLSSTRPPTLTRQGPVSDQAPTPSTAATTPLPPQDTDPTGDDAGPDKPDAKERARRRRKAAARNKRGVGID